MARTTFSGPLKVDTAFWANPILFADLPTASADNEGYIYYVSNARKASEGCGCRHRKLSFLRRFKLDSCG